MLFCEVILLCRWSRFVLWDDNVRSCLTILFSLCNVISMTPMQVCLDFRQQNMNSILFSIMLYRPRSFCRRGTWPLACRSGLNTWRLQSADWCDLWVVFHRCRHTVLPWQAAKKCRSFWVCLFEFRSFRSIRTIAGPRGVIGPLPRPNKVGEPPVEN